MPKHFSKKVHGDGVRVDRSSDASVALMTRDFGTSESCVRRWLAVGDIEYRKHLGATASESMTPRIPERRVHRGHQGADALTAVRRLAR